MYSVTKRIEFCYGHRLLDYDGVCKHPHGHNAVAEIEVRTDQLDNRNMVCDFSDIKRIVKGWIDAELDHKMVLRHDDPLVKPLQALGEPVFIIDSNPTVERLAKLIYDYATRVRIFRWSGSRYGKRPRRLRNSDPIDGATIGRCNALVDDSVIGGARALRINGPRYTRSVAALMPDA